MLLREATAQRAAIRFRRLYLESINAKGIPYDIAWRLTVLSVRAMWLSKEVVATVLIIAMMLLCTLPLGSENVPFFQRISYFALISISAVFGCIILFMPIGFLRIKGWVNSGVAAVLTVVLGVVWYAACFINIRTLLGIDLPFTVPEIFLRTGPVISIAIVLNLLISPYSLKKLLKEARPQFSLLNLMDEKKRGHLISMSAQGHYVSVATSKGSELFRMKSSDAFETVDPRIGVQIHRSHWIAISAIKSIDERNRTVELIDGQKLPISHQKMPTLTLELSRRNMFRQQEKLFSRAESDVGPLRKLFTEHENTRARIDENFLRAFQGEDLSERQKYSIAKEMHKFGTTSPTFLTTQVVHFVGLCAMGPFGLYTLSWYQPLLFWLIGYILMSLVVVPAHGLIWYLDLKNGSKAWLAIGLAFLFESLLAVAILPLLAYLMFGPIFVSVPVFFLSTLAMLSVILPNLYIGVREHQSYSSWKRALDIPPILLQIPYESRGEIVSISAGRRFVTVKTTAGDATVKKQFKEALLMLGERQGLQIHRSHWVASAFVKGRKVSGAANFVEMTTGDLVPLAAINIGVVDAHLGNVA